MTVLLHTVYRKNIRPFYIVPFALSDSNQMGELYLSQIIPLYTTV